MGKDIEKRAPDAKNICKDFIDNRLNPIETIEPTGERSR